MPSTSEEQRERNRKKVAAYRARNPEKSREASRQAVRRLRERRRAEGRSTYTARPTQVTLPKPPLAAKPKPTPSTKPDILVPRAPQDRVALIKERLRALQRAKIKAS